MKSFKNFKPEELDEKSPPNPRAEDWVKKNKERFKARYGEKKGLGVLYGHAWNLYKKWKSK